MEGPGRHAYPHEHLAVVSDGTYGYTIGGRCLSTDRVSTVFERFDFTIRWHGSSC